jgi:hypothetical protein
MIDALLDDLALSVSNAVRHLCGKISNTLNQPFRIEAQDRLHRDLRPTLLEHVTQGQFQPEACPFHRDDPLPTHPDHASDSLLIEVEFRSSISDQCS